MDEMKVLMLAELRQQAQEKRLQEYQKNKKTWKNLGKQYRQIREMLKISRESIAEKTGFSKKTIAKFEAGLWIRNRRYLEPSYKTALQMLELQCRLSMKNL